LAMLSLLDLSAAFDTVDHDTLLRRLQTSYGFDGIVIKWFITSVDVSSTCEHRPPRRLDRLWCMESLKDRS